MSEVKGPKQLADNFTLKPPIKAWSFSRLMNYEECPYRVYLSSVEKLPMPEIDDPAHPLIRGNRIHDEAERFVKGEAELTPDLKKFEDRLTWAREEYAEGNVNVEEEWGFNNEWGVTGYWDDDVWNRTKLDLMIRLDEKAALIVDHKTGKKFGNEVKHISQGQLYVVTTFLKFPELENIRVEFWYLDHKDTTLGRDYTRAQLPRMLARWAERGNRLTTATHFPPKPNKKNCRFCNFGIEKGTGACPYAVPLDA